MSIRKFFAPTARQALKEIRDELGADAMILSNRKTENGVEIIALAHEEIAHLTEQAVAQKTDWGGGITADEWARSVVDDPVSPAARQPAQPRPAAATHQPVAGAPRLKQPAPRVAPHGAVHAIESADVAARQHGKLPAAEPAQADYASPLVQSVVVPAQAMEVQENILKEIKTMSSMLQQQLAAMHWNDVQQRDPQRAALLRRMLNAGFSSVLARQLLDRMPANGVQGEQWIKQVFKRNLLVASEANDIVTKGGVYALIGPTGVGKTTTTAKLAARAVVRYGADKVALLTTDSYRIAAYEQLKIYGKILGVAVHAVKDADDLRLTLSALRHKHLVLIDTVGMGQRDQRVGDQAEMFDAAGVQCLMMLNATSSGDTLEDVVRMYRNDRVIGCITTKLDEAASLGTVLDVAVRHRLVLHYMANGQRVPEDLHTTNLDYMLHRAFKPVEEKKPFTLRDLDLPVMMAEMPGKEASLAL
ncbi:MAG: flagellar biosynthesis protein FlhF [Gallionella sp.]|jgi:flagellar biosynthesis protein FlhF|nr:flagellar biosynthesis protein FlhF [Gallionella sp.]MCK9354529.1 flagellar biosynthesis protein FlhF [Gallionella sp.]